jgi:glucans biosynthesis protein
VIRDGVPTPVAYQPQLFDYGRNRIERPLPINLGFAGFRLHYQLNDPRVLDELIAFLGASYFRFLGRDQRYGLPARGLVDQRRGRRAAGGVPVLSASSGSRTRSRAPTGRRSTRCSTAPARLAPYRFDVHPAVETTVDIGARCFRGAA